MEAFNGQPSSDNSLAEQLEVIYKIENSEERVHALIELAAQLPPSRSEVLQEAKQIRDEAAVPSVYEYESDVLQIKALVALASQLPESQRSGIFQQALDSTQWITSKKSLVKALAVLASQLPEPQRSAVLQRALDAVPQVNASQLAEVLSELMPQLSPSCYLEILATVVQTTYGTDRIQALTAFASQLLPTQTELLEQTLTAARQIPEEKYCIQLFAILAYKLPDQQSLEIFKEAFDIIQRIDNNKEQGQALAILAPQLPKSKTELLQPVLEMTQLIKSGDDRVKVLATLATKVDGFHRSIILQQIQEEAQQIKDEWSLSRVESFTGIVCLLPASQHTEALQQVLDVIQKIGHDFTQAQALDTLIPQFPSSHTELLHQALKVAEKIPYEEKRANILASLAFKFSGFQRSKILQQALDAARKSRYEWHRVQILSTLSSLLPDLGRSEILQKALEAAQQIKAPDDDSISLFESEDDYKLSKVEALAALIPQLPFPQYLEVLQQTLEVAQTINAWKGEARSQALVALAPLIPSSQPKLLLKVLEAALEISYGAERDRFKVFEVLFPRFPDSLPELLNPALEAVWEFMDKYYRFGALAVLLPRFSDSPRSEIIQQALNQIQQFVHPEIRAEALAALAPGLELSPASLLEQALNIATQINLEVRAEALVALVPRFSGSEQRLVVLKQALEATAQNISREKQTKIILALARQISPDQPEIFRQALEIAQQIAFEGDRADALAALACQLFPCEPGLFRQALDAAKQMNDEGAKHRVLASLVPNLSEVLLPTFLEAVLSLSEEKCIEVLKIIAERCPEDLAATFPSHQLLMGLETVKYLNGDADKIRFLSALATRLSTGLFSNTLRLIKDNIIKGDSYRAEALSNLAPYLPEDQFSEALDLVEQVIADASSQLEAVTNLVPYLSLSQLPEVVRIAQNLQDNPFKFRVLVIIASRLYTLLDEQLQPALHTANETKLTEAQTSTPELPDLVSSQVYQLSPEALQEELNLIQRISEGKTIFSDIAHLQRRRVASSDSFDSNFAQARLLIDLASQLRHAQPGLIQQALNLIKRIRDKRYRSEALNALVPRLPPCQPRLLQQALEAAQSLSNKEDRDRIVYAFSGALPVALIQQILKIVADNTERQCEQHRAEIVCILGTKLIESQISDVINIIKNFQDEGYKAQALKSLVGHLSENQEKLNEALQISKGFQQSYFKVKVFSVAPTKQLEAKRLAQEINAKFKCLGADALVEFASNSTSLSEQNEALRSIRELDYPYLQTEYLSRLAPHLLSRQQLFEAQLIAQNIREPYYRIKALIALALQFPELRQEARKAAEDLKTQEPVQAIELLSVLAVEVPDILPELVKSARATISESLEEPLPLDCKHILVALQPHLPARIVREIDRDRRAGKRISKELWNRALKQLARGYRDALKAGGLLNDEAQDTDLLNLKDEINSLADLLLLRDLEPPMVVGILGGWGGGKSYIIHLMQSRMVEIRSRGINKEEAWSSDSTNESLSPYVGHIYQIKFDAWSYAKSNLWASLMQTIFSELNRQVSLEQSLQAAGIEPYQEYANQIWTVLYKTNENDRQYFLEKALGTESLEALKQAQNEGQGRLWTQLIWDQYGDTQAKVVQKLEDKRAQLQATEDELVAAKRALVEKQTVLTDDSKPKELTSIEELIKNTTGFSIVILEKRFGKPVFEALSKEISTTLQKQKIDVGDVNSFGHAINRIIFDILEEDKVVLNDGNIRYSLSWNAFKKWFWKKRLLIIAFLVLVSLSIVLPILLVQTKSIIPQIAALITPLIPAIGLAQKLFKSNQKWYDQARQALQEYEEQLKQTSQQPGFKYQQLINSKESQEFRDLEAKVQNLEKQAQVLREAVQVAEKELPENTYASLADFVQARIQDATYDQHLGMMQQVKQDLAKLSHALLPPPVDSEEYKHKLNNLKKVFPRGPARVVVYIDDLDRCPPSRVVEVLEAVQLLVKTPLFIAVLAIDERYITRALEKYYAGVLSHRGRPSGTDYLEKIIQIPYRVRPISTSALENYLRSQVVIQDTATSGTKFSEVTRDEFNLLLECCRQVDLSPRTLKRLTNIYKLFKIVSRTRGTKPSRKVQQAILALLVLSGRYTDLIRGVLATIDSCYEENRELHQPLRQFFKDYCLPAEDSYLRREFDRFKHDALETNLIPVDLTLEDISHDTFNLVRSFSFVGDIGYAPEDFKAAGLPELNGQQWKGVANTKEGE